MIDTNAAILEAAKRWCEADEAMEACFVVERGADGSVSVSPRDGFDSRRMDLQRGMKAAITDMRKAWTT